MKNKVEREFVIQLGKLFAVLGALILLAFIFWVPYSYYGLGAKYFYFLPKLYQYIPFWDVVGLFFILRTLCAITFPFARKESEDD